MRKEESDEEIQKETTYMDRLGNGIAIFGTGRLDVYERSL